LWLFLPTPFSVAHPLMHGFKPMVPTVAMVALQRRATVAVVGAALAVAVVGFILFIIHCLARPILTRFRLTAVLAELAAMVSALAVVALAAALAAAAECKKSTH
jgi:hypothetical protein